jgi:hypothetical protein
MGATLVANFPISEKEIIFGKKEKGFFSALM